ncbi:MAG: GNAT family N-acetyltransferase [Planctomycetota bacterium]
MSALMEAVALQDFALEADAFNAAVFETPEIDRFCSSTDWILPAREAWGAHLDPCLLRGEHGWAALLRHVHAGEIEVLTGFDTMWGFACPLIGAEPRALVEEFAAQPLNWHVLLVAGIPPRAAMERHVREVFAPHCDLHEGPVLRRWVASLRGGLDAYLARRSPKLRENLRRATRRAREAGVTLETGRGPDLLRRVLSVEERSWKGPVHTGLLIEEMLRFYQPMAERLVADGRLRTIFARRDDLDIGYILGGVRDGVYRGFQFSFDRRHADLSLGALMQQAQIAASCAEGIETYDLGIDMEYKRHWADEARDTVTLVVVRR